MSNNSLSLRAKSNRNVFRADRTHLRAIVFLRDNGNFDGLRVEICGRW
ncbi:MAG: hypothetical protein MUE44_27525 [Oscillatoriaceae cyanobacterium Prado104]|nr:hypothetical protein [Oscillatoriaceae cyanobacterium Prado104]